MKVTGTLWSVALLLLVACEPVAPELSGAALEDPTVMATEVPEFVLFIGNSFTYYNEGVDFHLERLAEATAPPLPLTVESRTTPSQNLMGHYEDSTTHAALAKRPWDIVVLQGSSFEPVYQRTRPEFFAYADLLDREVRAVGARTAFFMTWAYRNEPEMTARLYGAYASKADELGAMLVPVGIAWERALQRDPSLSLYSDKKHPSLQGTYLAACVFYASLFARSPEGLSYRAGLDPDEAALLQRIAWETVRSFDAGDQ